ICIAKQFIRRAFHEKKIFQVGADPAEYAENKLNEYWRFEQSDIHAEFQVVQMSYVIALMLELNAMAAAQFFRHCSNIAKSITENIAIRIPKIVFFPIELPFLIAIR